MKRSVLVFKAPGLVEVQVEPLPPPGAGQVAVATRRAAISPGTEMLAFKGLLPPALPLDATIAGLSDAPRYPFRYGYSAVGTVVAAGPGVDEAWLGRRVFAFVPHASHFCVAPEALVPLPDALPDEEAVFLAAVETAVTLIMDGGPGIGERVAVFGQGIIGLLTVALLALFPIDRLTAVDLYRLRREASLEAGSDVCLSPEQAALTLGTDPAEGPAGPQGLADLVYELSGNPETLSAALAAAGYGGRVVIGSWYGSKTAPVDLGGAFHRNRIRIIGSQVSTLAPGWTGRWTKARRLQTALDLMPRIRPARFITHRFALDQAQAAYEWIARRPEETLQVIFTF